MTLSGSFLFVFIYFTKKKNISNDRDINNLILLALLPTLFRVDPPFRLLQFQRTRDILSTKRMNARLMIKQFTHFSCSSSSFM